jgi:hypothetical protein
LVRDARRHELELRLHHRRRVDAAERVVPGRQLVEHHAEGVEVGLGADLLGPTELLGRRVEHGPRELPFLCYGDAGLLQLRHPEVHDADLVVVRDQDVLGLEIAVNDAVGVDRGQPGGGLQGNLAEQRLGDRAQVEEQLA